MLQRNARQIFWRRRGGANFFSYFLLLRRESAASECRERSANRARVPARIARFARRLSGPARCNSGWTRRGSSIVLVRPKRDRARRLMSFCGCVLFRAPSHSFPSLWLGRRLAQQEYSSRPDRAPKGGADCQAPLPWRLLWLAGTLQSGLATLRRLSCSRDKAGFRSTIRGP